MRRGRPDEVSGLQLAWSARRGALRSERGRVRRAKWDKHRGRWGREQALSLAISIGIFLYYYVKRMINKYEL